MFYKSLRVVLLFAMLLMAGCESSETIGVEPFVKYDPPIVPVSFKYNFATQQFSLSTVVRFHTPIGTFAFGADLRPAVRQLEALNSQPEDMILVFMDRSNATYTIYHVANGDKARMMFTGQTEMLIERTSAGTIIAFDVTHTDVVQLYPTDYEGNLPLVKEIPGSGVAKPIFEVKALRNGYVRSGPGTDYLQFGVLNQGQTYEVRNLSSDGQWYEVVLPNGSTGWTWIDHVELLLNDSPSVNQEAPELEASPTPLPPQPPSASPPPPSGCVRPRIIKFYAGPPLDPVANFTLYYEVEGADLVQIHDRRMDNSSVGHDNIYHHDFKTGWALWAKRSGTPDDCYVVKSIEVDPADFKTSD